jgi:hypothetical protein
MKRRHKILTPVPSLPGPANSAEHPDALLIFHSYFLAFLLPLLFSFTRLSAPPARYPRNFYDSTSLFIVKLPRLNDYLRCNHARLLSAIISATLRMVHKILVALLSLALFLGLAAGAAIPSSNLQPEYEPSSTPVEAASWSVQSTDSSDGQVGKHALAKRAPYYFPETVPDAEEIDSRLTSMREAGFGADSRTQKSMEVAHARILPFRDLISELSARAEASMPTLPPMAFFVFVACAACIATIYRKINCKR